MASASFGMINPAVFEHLQIKIDEDAKVREELRNKLQDLEKQGECLSKHLRTLVVDLGSSRENHTVHSVSSTFDPQRTA